MKVITLWSVLLLFGGSSSRADDPISSLEFLSQSFSSELTLQQMQQQESIVQGIWWFEKMVVKGGFQHYLLISDPELIEQLLQDLKTVGALNIKALLAESLSIVYNGSPATEREQRVLLLAQLSDKQRSVLLTLQQKFVQQQPILRQRIADYLTIE